MENPPGTNPLQALQALYSLKAKWPSFVENRNHMYFLQWVLAQCESIDPVPHSVLKEEGVKLEEAGDLHHFLPYLEDFQSWLTKTLIEVASADIHPYITTPLRARLREAKNLLTQHQQMKDNIEHYTEDYNRIMDYGEKIARDQTDAPYILLRERVRSLQDGWNKLLQLCEKRQMVLSSSLDILKYKVKYGLNDSGKFLAKDGSSRVHTLRERYTELLRLWKRTQMVSNKLDLQLFKRKLMKGGVKLEEADDLHCFHIYLDHFESWLIKFYIRVASADVPSSVAEGENLRSQHFQIRIDIANYWDDYDRIMNYGDKIRREQTSARYTWLLERIRSLEDKWIELFMTSKRRFTLIVQGQVQCYSCGKEKQAEVLGNQQEHNLSKDESSEAQYDKALPDDEDESATPYFKDEVAFSDFVKLFVGSKSRTCLDIPEKRKKD